MAEEVVLMKGNEAIARAAIRFGVDGYFGYPITPQSEVLETLAELKPWETTGMVVLQAESEVAAINMVYGGAGSGKMVMTSSPARRQPETGRNLLHCSAELRPDSKRNARRTRTGYHPAQPGRLFPDHQRRRTRRLSCHRTGSGIGTGNGRFRRVGIRTGF